MKLKTKTRRGLFAMLLAFGVMTPATAHAAAFNPPPARPQQSSQQQRLQWQHDFHSGMDFRDDLGQPTVWNGTVAQNPFIANVRRDANVSNRPPAPRGGNTITPTDPTNWAFRQQQNNLQQNGFWDVTVTPDTNGLPRFDNKQQGVNLPTQQSPQSVNMGGNISTGGGGFLPPTSIN